MKRVAFRYDEDLKFIVDFMIPALDMRASMQEAILDDDVLDLNRIQGYKITYIDQKPHMSWDEETWNAYQAARTKETEMEKAQEVFNELAQAYALDMATDEQAFQMRYLYLDFDPNGHKYKQNDRFLWSENNKFYKVLQDHTSQSTWLPDNAPSLYVEISDPSVEWPEWKQPTGAHDAYSVGDKVSYNKEHYISQINGNTTVPGSDERWWKKVVETVEEPDPEEPSEPEVDEYPEWKQPTGAHDAYAKGAKVTYNGEKYISQIDANTTIPGTDERWWAKVVENNQNEEQR